jgi:hypothetical protein
MASIKEITSTFSDAVGPRRFVLPSLALAIGAFIDFFMLRYGLIDAESPYAFVPFMLGVLVAGILVIWWLLDYAADTSSELRGVVSLEDALDTLSTYFDEGSELVDAVVKNDAEYKTWETRRGAWQQSVQDYLQENFGLRERNLFRKRGADPTTPDTREPQRGPQSQAGAGRAAAREDPRHHHPLQRPGCKAAGGEQLA